MPPVPKRSRPCRVKARRNHPADLSSFTPAARPPRAFFSTHKTPRLLRLHASPITIAPASACIPDSPMCAMSFPTTPSTPTPAPPTANRAGVRRSLTLPTRFASPSTPSASADGIETLFNHSFAKVVLFTTASSLSRPSSSASNRTVLRDHGHTDTIPWVSPTESTVAAGAYKTPKQLPAALLILVQAQ